MILFLLSLCSACSDYNSRQLVGTWQGIETLRLANAISLESLVELNQNIVIFHPNGEYEGYFSKLADLDTLSPILKKEWKFIQNNTKLQLSHIIDTTALENRIDLLDNVPIQNQLDTLHYFVGFGKTTFRSFNSWYYQKMSKNQEYVYTINLTRIDTTLWGI
ncbi:MAG: hypothetical protein MK212_07680 [Saprospiraceae bacterium]|nr:hypothetical protein [Saprospiraceae bacterium]